MDKDGKPKIDLADELESLRDEIAHLHSLIEIPASDVRAPSDPAEAEIVTEASSFPPNLFEDGPLGMAFVDPAFVDTHFHITRTNAAFRRFLGYSQEEIQSLQIQDGVQTGFLGRLLRICRTPCIYLLSHKGAHPHP